MKLNIEQYRWILLNCNLVAIQHKGKQHALITPKYPKHNAKLHEIIGGFEIPTTEEWFKLSQELRPIMTQHAQTRYSLAVRKLSTTPTTELAWMQDEIKIELLDDILFDVFGNDAETMHKNEITIEAYKDKIEAMLLNIQLPKKFIQSQLQKVANFCNELKLIPDTRRRFADWGRIDLQEKELMLQNNIGAFNRSFGGQIELVFFTKEDWENLKLKRPALKKMEMPIEYKDRSKIYINTEALEDSKDLYILAVLLQEALFLNIKHSELSNRVIEKLLEAKFTRVSFDHKKELRIISPIEAHIYGMSDEVGRFLRQEMGIKYINGQYTENVNQIVKANRDKARSIFHYQMYKNNNLYKTPN